MDFLYSVIGYPLGFIMWLCYQITKNYGIALFLFTLISRLAMLPLSFKQQKSSAKMSMIQPRLQELQKKYANNREKLTEEMNKLYQKEGYSPTSGCLPMLLPILIMFGLIDVIYKPLRHILHLPAETIDIVNNIAKSLGLIPQNAGGLHSGQILAVQSIKENVTPWLDGGLSQQIIDQISSLNLNFFGMNLGLRPSTGMFADFFGGNGFNSLLLIPILAGVSALAMSLISMRVTAHQTASMGGAGGGMMKGMLLVMPVFSVMIAFQVPAGVGLYWFYSNLFAMGQSLLLNKFYNPKELIEQAQKEKEEREEQERQERIEAKKLAKQKALESGEENIDEKALSQKEINRRKLAEARRRDAEKYGEEYVDVTDEDIR